MGACPVLAGPMVNQTPSVTKGVPTPLYISNVPLSDINYMLYELIGEFYRIFRGIFGCSISG